MKKVQLLTHGGDWAGFEIEYGKEPLDFSMNVNPLGIPEEVQTAIAEAGQSADRYPDPLCRALVQKLAEHEEVSPEWVFCGNGAADIIFRLAQALKPAHRSSIGSEIVGATGNEAVEFEARPDAGSTDETVSAQASDSPTLLITAPTFSEYESAFAEYGWEIRRFPLREETGFRIGEDFLQAIDENVDAVFLCEPNNPTGVTTDRQVLQKIMERCRETETLLIIDECFNGFLEDPAAHSMKSKLGGGLIILKAFTKLYGMAGVRLGYCLCADEEILEKIRAAGPPWNVSSLAQTAGIAALDATEHVAKGLQIVREERPWMKEQLRKLGVRQIYGEANYVLFHSMPALDERLRERGILIRNCSNYPGLDEGWYRIAVRTHEENRRLIEAMRAVIRD